MILSTPCRSAAQAPIGLFDSGVGGTTVLAEIRRQLPGEDLLYLADQAHCPYGPRPAAELCELALARSSWLVEQGAKIIVVACNSASAAALGTLRAAFPEVPFVGVVPAVKPAARISRSGVVGVLATPATIAGDLLREVIERWAVGVQVLAQPCEGLAEAVEAGAADTLATHALVVQYVEPLVRAGADTLVLGCTHYPLLLPQIRAAAGPGAAILDSAPAVARQTMRVLAERRLLRASGRPALLTYATTGSAAPFAALLGRIGMPAGHVIHV
jgi:glutamate racemase